MIYQHLLLQISYSVTKGYAALYLNTSDLGNISGTADRTHTVTHLHIKPTSYVNRLQTGNKPVNMELDFNTLSYTFNNVMSLQFSAIKLNSVININVDVTAITFITVYFTNIKYRYFEGLIKLKLLKIRFNDIRNITNDIFKDLKSLLTLDLETNNIKYITSGAFHGLIKLKTLRLNNNKIIGLDKGTFNIHNKTGIYESIEIRNNALKTIKSGLFISHYIKRIDLSINNISNIERNAFNTTQLETLYLHDNLLSNIDERVFGNLNSNLKIFTIYNNNINCDCKIFKWLDENRTLLKFLNSSTNMYIKCYRLEIHLFEYKKRNNCTSNKGK